MSELNEILGGMIVKADGPINDCPIVHPDYATVEYNDSNEKKVQ